MNIKNQKRRFHLCTYYKFKITYDSDLDQYAVHRLVAAGERNLFDDFYYRGKVVSFPTLEATKYGENFPRVIFKYEAVVKRKPDLVRKVFNGFGGNARILANGAIIFNAFF